MAKVEYADAIKTVSGALTKINKKSAHAADQKMVLATHRTAPTTNPDCSRIYLRGISSVTRTTPIKATEMEARMRFGEIGRAVQARMKDLSKIATDQQSFNAQKDQPGGKKTMLKYLWSLEAAKYDQEHAG